MEVKVTLRKNCSWLRDRILSHTLQQIMMNLGISTTYWVTLKSLFSCADTTWNKNNKNFHKIILFPFMLYNIFIHLLTPTAKIKKHVTSQPLLKSLLAVCLSLIKSHKKLLKVCSRNFLCSCCTTVLVVQGGDFKIGKNENTYNFAKRCRNFIKIGRNN